jgi:hypothetical protein
VQFPSVYKGFMGFSHIIFLQRLALFRRMRASLVKSAGLNAGPFSAAMLRESFVIEIYKTIEVMRDA